MTDDEIQRLGEIIDKHGNFPPQTYNDAFFLATIGVPISQIKDALERQAEQQAKIERTKRDN